MFNFSSQRKSPYLKFILEHYLYRLWWIFGKLKNVATKREMSTQQGMPLNEELKDFA